MVYAKVASGLGYLKSKRQSLASKIKLRSDKTFIVPTGFGLSFAGISFVLLVMAIGYANNLLYFFVFLLISMALTGMRMTNKNVDSIVVNDVAINNVFAGEDNSIDLRLRNQNAKNYCWDIEVGFANSDVRKFFSTVEEIQTEKKCSLIWKPQRRGVQAFPRVLIQSRFPYRMLRAWKYYSEKSEVIIFPERKGSDRIPKIQGKQSENELQAQAYEQGLFRDFRDFEKSDSPTRIDWKRSLKHQKHLVKNFETSGEKRVLLTWEMTAGIIDFEARVSQLAYWIDMCHQKQELYCLILNDEKPLYANSLNHYRESLQRLALLEGV